MINKYDILRPKCRRSKLHPDEDFTKEEDLTIGMAFRCTDGIVLAADRLRTKGEFGTFVTKVRRFTPRKNLVGALVGAGRSAFIGATYDRINGALKDQMTLPEAKDAIDGVRRKMYEDDIKPQSGEDEPHFSLLVALWSREGGFELLSGESDAPMSVIEEDNYKAIGSGAPLANCLVNTFYTLDGSCEDAALISAMTIKLVKRYIDDCGGGTNIVAVTENGLATPRSTRAIEQVENCFLGFFDVLREVFSSLTLQDKSDWKEFQKLRSGLQEFLEGHRRSPLLVRRFPREKKKEYAS